MTTHYTIYIEKHKLKLKVGYRSGKFWRVERVSGQMTDTILDSFGIVVPLLEKEVQHYQNRYGKNVTYTKIEKKKSLYTQFSDAWFVFYEQFAGIEPKFTGVEGKALKQIITYLKKVAGDDAAALELWKVILSKWKHLSDFHKQNTDLKYINSKLNIILNELKANTGKNATSGGTDDLRAKTAERLGIIRSK